MLREVCDACGKVIEGEPRDREEPDAALLMGDEVVLMYESLCPACSDALRVAVRDFERGKRAEKPKVPQNDTVIAPIKVVEKPANGDVVDSEAGDAVKLTPEDFKDGNAPQKAPQAIDKESLPNQVTKQFPINLPERRS